jgi:hypothetical protein
MFPPNARDVDLVAIVEPQIVTALDIDIDVVRRVSGGAGDPSAV